MTAIGVERAATRVSWYERVLSVKDCSPIGCLGVGKMSVSDRVTTLSRGAFKDISAAVAPRLPVEDLTANRPALATCDPSLMSAAKVAEGWSSGLTRKVSPSRGIPSTVNRRPSISSGALPVTVRPLRTSLTSKPPAEALNLT